jgi:hypothetical protein
MENEFRRKQYFILSDADVNHRLYGRKLSLLCIIIGNSLSQLITRGDISDATIGAGSSYPSEAPSVFNGVRIILYLVLWVCFVDRCWHRCALTR